MGCSFDMALTVLSGLGATRGMADPPTPATPRTLLLVHLMPRPPQVFPG